MKLKRTLIILAAIMLPLSSLTACASSDTTCCETPPVAAGSPSAKVDGKAGTSAAADAELPAAVPKKAAEAAKSPKTMDADAPKKAALKEARSESAELVLNAESFADADADDGAAHKDVVRESPKMMPDVESDVPSKDDIEEPVPPSQMLPDDPAEAFVLTAGEWNDNRNWGFFSNLVNKNMISFPAFGLNPLGRVEVTVEIGGKPARNIAAELVSPDGDVLWKAQTDPEGHAYLFYDPANGGDKLTVRAAGESSEVTLRGSGDTQSGKDSVGESAVKISLPEGEAPVYKKNEVMFILDTTGSMGDEILYLQKDFSAIAEETAAENVQFSMNFYRDTSDLYVTRCNPFTSDVKLLQSQLNREHANGGGDTPEAVAEILTETITKGSWSADANKLAFLIFDAPPHDDKSSIEKVESAVRSAAEQGIHVVPVVASNSDRETELFGRALAVMTDSNYVFLTDDSGVGGSHLEPIIGKYDVEKLHDIIVRNIRAMDD